MIDYIALLVAFAVSGVSAYYSIIGLTAIFASAYYPVIVMGVALELGKLVSASWLYRNWNHTPFLLKSYLSFAVVILMIVSSMGIFGFLSKAHIEQQLSMSTGQADQLAIIESKIEFTKSSIADLDKQIAQIDNALTKMTDRGQAASSLQAADRQRKTRNELVKKKEGYVKELSELTTERVSLTSGIKKLEAEVGPIKYIAELVYSNGGTENLERSVRAVIILLVLVFDPLAVVLLLAANHGLNRRKQLTFLKEPSILKIDDEVLGDVNVVERKTD
jgi:cell division protein FtsB